jgi:hypothetical protein
MLEPLESRIGPAASLVTNLDDAGPGSLRDAKSKITGNFSADGGEPVED